MHLASADWWDDCDLITILQRALAVFFLSTPDSRLAHIVLHSHYAIKNMASSAHDSKKEVIGSKSFSHSLHAFQSEDQMRCSNSLCKMKVDQQQMHYPQSLSALGTLL